MTGRYKAYSEYKDSGVDWFGDIPSAWKFLPLKRNFKIVNGSTPRSSEASFWDGDITWVTPADLSKVDVHISGSSKNITNKGLSSCGTSLVPKGSLILSTRAPIGTIAIASKELCTNQGCKSLVLYNNVDSKFYYYVISVSGKQLNNLGRGTTFLELSTDELSNFAVPTPSFAEQQKIANFLDHETAKIDTLITKQEKLIELLKEKRQAVISHAVTKGLNSDAPMKDSGVEWLGEVPEHWDMKRLKYIGEARNGLTYSPDDVVTQEEGILVLRSSNIQDARLSFSDNVYVNMDIPTRIRTKENDLLICSRNGSRQLIGKNALITKEAADMAFGAFMVVFRSKINPYLYWVLNSPLFDYQSGSFLTSTINQLTIGNLENMEIPLPPECEQEEIKKHLIKKSDYFDDLTSKALHKVNLLKERKTALISAAVTGKIDVRHFVAEQGQPQGVQG